MIAVLRLLCALALFLLGAVSVLAAVLVHADWWGLLLAWGVVVAILVATPNGWHGRPAFTAGWVLMLVASLTTRPEGDFLVASDLSGYGVLATAPVLIVASLVGLSRGCGRPRRSSELSGVGSAS